MNSQVVFEPSSETHEPIYRQVYSALREQIVNGQRPPGSFLPPERELETEFGVARKTLRQATAMLKKEGLIVSRRGMGTIVSEVESDDPSRDRRRTPAVAVLVDEWVFNEPYRMRLFSHLGMEAGRIGLRATMVLLPVQEPELRRLIADRELDALIAFHFWNPRHLECVRDARMPVLMLETREGMPRADHAVVNNVPGAMEAVRELVRLGHRRIAYVGGLVAHRRESSGELYRLAGDSPERFGAYRRVLEDAGIAFSQELYREIRFDDDAADELVADWVENDSLPSAVFAFDDALALYLIGALQRADLRLPDDISVVGFGNIVPEAQSGRLATVAVDYEEMARLSVQRIRERVENGGMGEMLLRASCRFKPGASIAPPRGADVQQP